MTRQAGLDYCALLMDPWQHKAAFVIQFRPETDVAAGRFEGKVEHIESYKEARFHSLDQLLAFVAQVLDDLRTPGK